MRPRRRGRQRRGRLHALLGASLTVALLESCAATRQGPSQATRTPPRAPSLRITNAAPANTDSLAFDRLLHAARTRGLGPPRADSAGAMRWREEPGPAAPAVALSRDDSIGAWSYAARDSGLHAYALHRLAPLLLARGDTTRADSSWAELTRTRSLWTWAALKSRVALALARRNCTVARQILDSTERTGWPALEVAERDTLLATVSVGLADTARAVEICREVIHRYPALPPALSALRQLDSLLSRRNGSLTAEDLRAGAEVDFWHLDRLSAGRRLARAFGLADPSQHARIALRGAEVLRTARRFAGADSALSAALAAARDPGTRVRIALERARNARDADRPRAAFKYYLKCAQLASELEIRDTAWWERAREQEFREHWPQARADYRRVVSLAGRHADEAAFRAGLLWWAEGRRDSAEAWLGHSRWEAAEFWRAIVRRPRQPAGAESTLARLAHSPGYSFYRAAARETLGVRGFHGGIEPGDAGLLPDPARDPSGSRSEPPLALASQVAALGGDADAAAIAERWAAGDARARDPRRLAPDWDAAATVTAARVAFAAGRVPLGIRLARQAFDAWPDSLSERRWATVPWIYPPAFDSLYATFPESARAGTIDRALIRAVSWQESRFDPDARSRSNALGLMQLKLDAALDVARWRHEPAPTESALRDPGSSLRFGAAYLTRLLARFEGDPVAALAAYNAGAARITPRWREIVARGGDALLAELAAYAETEDYVKRILGVRQAYRELKPTTDRAPR